MTMIYLLKTITKAAYVAVPLLLISCADNSLEFWRQVPIQIARVTQTESYKQTFRIETPLTKNMKNPEKDHKLDERMDKIFTSLIGPRNWQYLKNLYGVSDIRDELIKGKIHMDGLINFVVYLDPTDLDYIVIEGSGRYFAIRDKTSAILMSGDFYIPPQRNFIGSLDNSSKNSPTNGLISGCIPLDIKIYTTRIPGKTTYYKDVKVRYELNIDTTNKEHNAYSINYEKNHSAYLDIDNDGSFDKDRDFIASLEMKSRYQQVKLFDLSGMAFIKKNYRIAQYVKLKNMAASKIEQKRQCINTSDPAKNQL